MAVTAACYAPSRQILFDQNGKPVPGGIIEVFAAGTTTHVTSYADAGLTSPNPNPMTTDGFGRIPPIYFGQGAFRVVVYNQGAAVMWVDDGIPGGVDYAAQAAAAAAAAQSTTGQWQTGDIKAAHGKAAQSGWIVLNGGTIGNAASGGNARTNADTQALFVFLWNNDPSLTVSSGRGATATADFNAGKTIAVPDYRGRTLVGCDGMGLPLAGVLTASSIADPANRNKVGWTFGLDGVTLTTDGLPASPPQITISAGGGHSHTGTTDGGGVHSHGGSTSQDGKHHHTYVKTTIANGVSGTNYGDASVSNDITSDDGLHSHTIQTDQATAHTHTFTTAAVGDHNHTLTIANLGAGNPHGNAQPSVLIFWHIRL